MAANQLIFAWFATSIRRFVMKGKNKLFHPEEHQCPTKFSLDNVKSGKDSFEIVLTQPQVLQNASWNFLSHVWYLEGVKGLALIEALVAKLVILGISPLTSFILHEGKH